MEIPQPLIQAAWGALGSFFINGSTFIKNTNLEGFNKLKFGKSIFVGAIVGFVSGLTGIDQTVLIASTAYGSIGIFVENILKAIGRAGSKLRLWLTNLGKK